MAGEERSTPPLSVTTCYGALLSHSHMVCFANHISCIWHSAHDDWQLLLLVLSSIGHHSNFCCGAYHSYFRVLLSIILFPMAPKQKKFPNLTQSQKKGGKVKNRRWAKLLPVLPTSDTGVWTTDDDQESSLCDVIAMHGNINTRLIAAEETMHLASSSAATESAEDEQPCSRRGRPTSAPCEDQDALHEMEDHVHARIAGHLR